MKKHNDIPKRERGWKHVLTPEQYAIMREKGTEKPFTGKLLTEKRDGMYACSACGSPLFTSDVKFDSGTGWPSFSQAIQGAVRYTRDASNGMERIEVSCAFCGSHLGHIFNDGPTLGGKRYCVNSTCLEFEEKKKK
ncbi:MAG: peptide-methionine (R)-S-oxide reductase MsrB [Candidatus Paceibacterota bacterium]|jgi:peptide-methionine (R)-S-oxide reductase